MNRFDTALCVFLCVMVFASSQANAQQASSYADFRQQRFMQHDDTGLTSPAADAPMTVRAAERQWSSGHVLPAPKFYHALCCAEDYVYVFAGGQYGNFDPRSYRYDTSADSWSEISEFPVEQYFDGCAEYVNGKIYIFGGTAGYSSTYDPIPDMWEYDPVTDEYVEKTPMPNLQSCGASAVIDGKIYYIGGMGATYNSMVPLVQVYDPATDSWSRLTDLPAAVAWAGATEADGALIVTGGSDASRVYKHTFIGIIEGGNITWKPGRDYPKSSGVVEHAAGTADGAAYFFTGYTYAAGQFYPLRDSYRYDPATDEWSPLEQKPNHSTGNKRAPSDGRRMYLAGGMGLDGELDVLDIFDSAIEAGAIAQVDPAHIDAWIKTGSSDDMTIMRLFNPGVYDLNWTAEIENSVPWMSLTTDNGVVHPGEMAEIPLNIKASTFTSGEYGSALIVHSNDAQQPMLRVPITLHVQDEDVDTAMTILIEQFTGTWCGYCPYGAEELQKLADEFGDRIVRASWHDGDEMQLHNYYDVADLLGVQFFPAGSIARIHWPGEPSIPVEFETWRERVNTVLDSLRSPVSLRIANLTFNQDKWSAELDASVFFHRGMSGDLRISAYIVEDNVNAPQRKYLQSGGEIVLDPYYHMSVVRYYDGTIEGVPLLQNGSIGSQELVTFHYDMPLLVSRVEESSVIVFVHEFVGGAPGKVLQAVRASMAPLTDVHTETTPHGLALGQNYPNPFNPTTTITFHTPATAEVLVEVRDNLGRHIRTLADGEYPAGEHSLQFDGSGLPTGTYIVVLRSGDRALTRSMTLLK